MPIKNKSLKKILFLFTLFIASQLSSQNFWNNSLEYEATNKLPRKWSIESEGKKTEANLTDKVFKHGEKSLEVSLFESEFYLLQVVAVASKNNKFTFSSYIKVKENSSLVFSMLVIDKVNGNAYNFDAEKFVNSDWNLIQLNKDLVDADENKNLLIALKVTGTGTFWVDDFAFSINEEEFGNGPLDFREPTKKEILRLNEYAHPIHIDKQSNYDALDDMMKDVKIVGLGENSHGSSTIFKMKLQLVKYLVKEQGFTVFALESPAVEADYINDYVLYDEGTIEGVLENLVYPNWKIDEMINIIEWIKHYNIKAKNKVSFKGIDMQSPTQAFKKLKEFGEKKKNQKIIDLLNDIKELYQIKNKSNDDWNNLLKYTSSLGLTVSEYSELKDDEKYHYYTDILYQSFSLISPRNEKSRDSFMADNIRYLYETCQCKVIVSADNDHLRKSYTKAGHYLKNFLNDAYLSIGFTFNKGTYSAYGEKEFYSVDASYSGTYEYLFSQSKYKNYFLNLSQITDIPLLDKKSGFRIIGSRPQENGQFFEMNLKSNFDVLFYLSESEHTKRKK